MILLHDLILNRQLKRKVEC